MILKQSTLALCLIFSLLFNQEAVNQEKRCKLDIDFPANTANQEWIAEVTKSLYIDSTEAVHAMVTLRDRYYQAGYLAAGFNSLEVSDSFIRTAFYSGYSYNWGRVSLPRIHPPGFPRVPRSHRVKSGTPISIEKIENIRDAYVEMYENNGYPFASVRYDSIKISDSIVEASIIVDPGRFLRIDSIVYRSDGRV